jgi:hypothetical protein
MLVGRGRIDLANYIYGPPSERPGFGDWEKGFDRYSFYRAVNLTFDASSCIFNAILQDSRPVIVVPSNQLPHLNARLMSATNSVMRLGHNNLNVLSTRAQE